MIIDFPFTGHQAGIPGFIRTDYADVIYDKAEIHIHTHDADKFPVLIKRRHIGYHIHINVFVVIGFQP